MTTSSQPLRLSEIHSLLKPVRLLVMDVDGVLTDGSIQYTSTGEETKQFHVADGLGLVLLRFADVSVVWITGRASNIVERRARELGVTHLFQNVQDKGKVLREISKARGLSREQVAYIGDDWNDLPAFESAGVRIAVANAGRDVQARADAVTLATGGRGAVREVCETILDARSLREACMQNYLHSLTQSGTVGISAQ